MKRIFAVLGMLAITASPAIGQKLGKGGIGIDESTEVPRCARPLGTIAVVEERAAGGTAEGIPPGLAALTPTVDGSASATPAAPPRL